MTKDDVLSLAPISNELLDICYNRDEFATSDLQGAIEAQVMKAYRLGYNN